jgi:hypothetical protein
MQIKAVCLGRIIHFVHIEAVTYCSLNQPTVDAFFNENISFTNSLACLKSAHKHTKIYRQ